MGLLSPRPPEGEFEGQRRWRGSVLGSGGLCKTGPCICHVVWGKQGGGRGKLPSVLGTD